MEATAPAAEQLPIAALQVVDCGGEQQVVGEGGGEVGSSHVESHGFCAICLDKIVIQETALVKGCEHAYCVMCILRWATYKKEPLCPQCKHPFKFLNVHRSLDGCIHDYMFEESVCLLLRATWFVPLNVEDKSHPSEDPDEFFPYEFELGDDDDADDDLEDAYYMSRSSSIRIGNRRWGDGGYVRAGRKEARPANRQFIDDSGAGPSRGAKKKEPAKDPTGRRAKRAMKREAAEKAAAAKHQQHLLRLDRK